jgi:hypothetical protein
VFEDGFMQRLTCRRFRLGPEKVYGTEVYIKEAREILPTDDIEGGYAGVYSYQQTAQTVEDQVLAAFVNGDMNALKDAIHAALPSGPTILYMRFSWNQNGDIISDLAVGFVMSANQAFTANQLIDAAKSVSWFGNFFNACDMGPIRAWKLTVGPDGDGLPLELLIAGIIVVAVAVVVVTKR